MNVAKLIWVCWLYIVYRFERELKKHETRQYSNLLSLAHGNWSRHAVLRKEKCPIWRQTGERENVLKQRKTKDSTTLTNGQKHLKVHTH